MEVTHVMIIVAALLGITFAVIIILCSCCLYSSRCKNCRRKENQSGGFSYRAQVDDDVEQQSNISSLTPWSRTSQASTSRGVSADEQQRRIALYQKTIRRAQVLEEQRRAWQTSPQQTLGQVCNHQLRELPRQQQVPREHPLQKKYIEQQRQLPVRREQLLQKQYIEQQRQQPFRQAVGIKENLSQRQPRPVAASPDQIWNENNFGGRGSRRNRSRPKHRSQSLSRLESSKRAPNKYIRNEEKTLDLHNYFLAQAKQAVIKFIKENEKVYHKNNYREEDRYVYIITGRGLHSKDRVPKIKPAVQSYLHKHKYKNSWDEPGGMVTVEFLSNQRNPLKTISQEW